MPTPALEMRPSPSAEPPGRREPLPAAGIPRSALPRLRGGGPPLQGVPSCRSQRWRCARPRARSPRGDENPCPPQASPDRRCRAFAVEDHRTSRGSAKPIHHRHAAPSAGDALVPERGAPGATRTPAHRRPPQIGAAAPSRWSPPHLQGVPAKPIHPRHAVPSAGASPRHRKGGPGELPARLETTVQAISRW